MTKLLEDWSGAICAGVIAWAAWVTRGVFISREVEHRLARIESKLDGLFTPSQVARRKNRADRRRETRK